MRQLWDILPDTAKVLAGWQALAAELAPEAEPARKVETLDELAEKYRSMAPPVLSRELREKLGLAKVLNP